LLVLTVSWDHYAVLLLVGYLAVLDAFLSGRIAPRWEVAIAVATGISFAIWSFVLQAGTDYDALPTGVIGQPLFAAKTIATLIFFAALYVMLRTDPGAGDDPDAVPDDGTRAVEAGARPDAEEPRPVGAARP
jgi:hypothetical protein